MKTPYVAENAFHVYNQYTIETEDRDTLTTHLKEQEIGYGIYYPVPLHEQPIINDESELPNTNTACKHVVSIPVHPSLTQEDREKVVETINNVEKP